MRKILPGFFLLFSSLTCSAQLVLEYGKTGPFIDKDTFHIGDTFTVSYWLVNKSKDTSIHLNATITTYMTTNKVSTKDSAATLDPQSVNIQGGGDSELVVAPFLATDVFFNDNEPAIVVVWPTGGGTENVIRTRKTVPDMLFIEKGSHITESRYNANHVRIYPQPARHGLKVELSGTLVLSELSLTDVQGRRLPNPVLMNGYMDLGYLRSGLFILQLYFQDGSISTFRIIKQ
jgi:hypothetical protein